MEEWLKKVIAARKNYYDLLNYDNSLKLCEVKTNEIHIYDGIERLATELCLPVETIKRDDFKYTHEKYIQYEGYYIFQLVEGNDR